MLKYMTKEEFKNAVDERRFVVNTLSENKYEVFMMSVQTVEGMAPQFGITRVINPDTKDGNFRQTGGGFNKRYACIEDIAYYLNRNAEDKDTNELDCIKYVQQKQRYNEI